VGDVSPSQEECREWLAVRLCLPVHDVTAPSLFSYHDVAEPASRPPFKGNTPA